MNPNPNDIGSLFGAQHVPGLGFVQVGGGTHLGDESAVMMISGVGVGSEGRQVAVDPVTGAVQSVTGVGMNLLSALKQPVTFVGITLPLWLWLAILISGVGIAGYLYFFKR